MSSAVITISHLDIEDPGVCNHIQKHLAGGCPLAPIVEALTPDYDPAERPRLIAEMVSRARDVIATQNELAANDSNDAAYNFHEKQLPEVEKPKRGRKASPERAALKEAAKALGVSESTARRDMQRAEPERVVPKAPGMDEQMAAAQADLARVSELLNNLRANIDALKSQWDRQDGRWALLGAVAQSWKATVTASKYIAEARGFYDAMERGVHGQTSKQRPVSAFAVSVGRDNVETAAKPPRIQPAEALAADEIRRVTNAEADARALETSKAIAGAGPRTGLGGKKLRIELPPTMSPEEQASVFAAADAAGVGPGDDSKGRW